MNKMTQRLTELDFARTHLVNDFIDPARGINAFIESSNKIYAGFQQALNIKLPTIDPNIYTNFFTASIEPVYASFKRLNPIIAQASKIMAYHGWWILDFLPLTFYRELIQVKDQVTTDELTVFIVKETNKKRCERLASLVTSWDGDVFKKRQDIFEQALWAHTRKKYAVTIPALVVQVEGIIRDFVAAHDGYTAWKLDPVKERLKQKFEQVASLPITREMEFDDVDALRNYHNLQALDKLYMIYDPAKHVAPDDVNRHALSHGLWVEYPTQAASTKLFLLLDMLHSMLADL